MLCNELQRTVIDVLLHFTLKQTPSSSLHLFITEAALTLRITRAAVCEMNTKLISEGKQSELDPGAFLLWCHQADLHFTFCRGYS